MSCNFAQQYSSVMKMPDIVTDMFLFTATYIKGLRSVTNEI